MGLPPQPSLDLLLLVGFASALIWNGITTSAIPLPKRGLSLLAYHNHPRNSFITRTFSEMIFLDWFFFFFSSSTLSSKTVQIRQVSSYYLPATARPSLGKTFKTACEISLDIKTACEISLDIKTACEIRLHIKTACQINLDITTACETSLDSKTACEIGLDIKTASKISLDIKTACEINLDIKTACKFGLDIKTACKSQTQAKLTQAPKYPRGTLKFLSMQNDHRNDWQMSH